MWVSRICRWRISLFATCRLVSLNIVLYLEEVPLIRIMMSWRWIDLKWFTNTSYEHPLFMVMFERERRCRVCFPTWRLKWMTSSSKLDLKTEYIFWKLACALSSSFKRRGTVSVMKLSKCFLLSGWPANRTWPSCNLNIRHKVQNTTDINLHKASLLKQLSSMGFVVVRIKNFNRHLSQPTNKKLLTMKQPLKAA